MKIFFLFLFLVLIFSNSFSQENINNSDLQINETIKQISSFGLNTILNLQISNQENSNTVISKQFGEQNRVEIFQNKEPGSFSGNLAYNLQQGNSNEMTLGQIGSGNLFFGFQLGVITTQYIHNQQHYLETVFDIASSGTKKKTVEKGIISDGEENKIGIAQQGTNNGVMVIQQGDENFLSAEQRGKNNILFVLQNGDRNSIKNFKQANTSDALLFDSIIQQGENLSLKIDEVSRFTPNKNIFNQTGSNLTLELKNDLINSSGGIQIDQKGHDMKVIIEQSYFPNPL